MTCKPVQARASPPCRFARIRRAQPLKAASRAQASNSQPLALADGTHRTVPHGSPRLIAWTHQAEPGNLGWFLSNEDWNRNTTYPLRGCPRQSTTQDRANPPLTTARDHSAEPHQAALYNRTNPRRLFAMVRNGSVGRVRWPESALRSPSAHLVTKGTAEIRGGVRTLWLPVARVRPCPPHEIADVRTCTSRVSARVDSQREIYARTSPHEAANFTWWASLRNSKPLALAA
jgi:hypothetical protein